MDYLLEETVPAAELKKFESRYMNELDTDGKVAAGTQFEYAWCLVRSKYPADIRKGIALLEDLFQVGNLATLQSDKSGHRKEVEWLSWWVPFHRSKVISHWKIFEASASTPLL